MVWAVAFVGVSIGLHIFERSIGFAKYEDAYMLGSMLHNGFYFLVLGIHFYGWNRWRGWTKLRRVGVGLVLVAGLVISAMGVHELAIWPEV